MRGKKAIIIGAGPAGLTAALELLRNTDIKPVIFETSEDIGGISKTVNYKGNRIDIGGHRFFSKSEWVMNWWQEMLPLQDAPSIDDRLLDRKIDRAIFNKGPISKAPVKEVDPEITDRVMLIRSRLSRILFLGRFFDYPISISRKTFSNLGISRVFKIAMSYMKACMFPIKRETSLEDFFINRFGRELYKTFFKDYTEKVWGKSCSQIKPEWGTQRIKGLSVTKAVLHAVNKMVSSELSLLTKNVETSLIEAFLYPKLGPGQLWELAADNIRKMGGEIYLQHTVTGVRSGDGRIGAVLVRDERSGLVSAVEGDYFFSSMPVKDLIEAFGDTPASEVREVANGLVYRDFITVGLLLKKLRIKNESGIKTLNGIIPDNWIYIQEKGVRIGRLQVFNNWSPYLVNDMKNVWLGIEYFCNEGDELWRKVDNDLIRFAVEELSRINIIEGVDVLDGTVIRVTKAYPAYFGSYDSFDTIRKFTDSFENLFLIGRNGMHRYNNQDHSMLAAKTAVDNIINGVKTKDNIWAVNTETEYHEG
jgi:protoporphyrinogen oxidase